MNTVWIRYVSRIPKPIPVGIVEGRKSHYIIYLAKKERTDETRVDSARMTANAIPMRSHWDQKSFTLYT